MGPLVTPADLAFQDQKEMTVSRDDKDLLVLMGQRETKVKQAFQAHLG